MADRILLDTNVVVYAYDRSEPEKQARAFKILERLQDTGSGALTTQVLVPCLKSSTSNIGKVES